MAEVRCIYQIVRLGTSDCYIGQTVGLRKRKATHLGQLRRGKHHSVYLQNAFNKYGEGAFSFEKASPTRAGTKASDETRRKMSLAHMGKRHALGAKHSPEVCAMRRDQMMGNKHAAGHRKSDELLRAHSEKMMGNQYARKREKDQVSQA